MDTPITWNLSRLQFWQNDPAFWSGVAMLAISIAVALIVAAIVAQVSGHLLGLPPHHRLWAFIVGFAFLLSLTLAPMADSLPWGPAIFFYCLPVFATIFYFMPTAIAVTGPDPSYREIFLLNLCLGWTLVGWIVALVWAVRRPKTVDMRITPLGPAPTNVTPGRRPA